MMLNDSEDVETALGLAAVIEAFNAHNDDLNFWRKEHLSFLQEPLVEGYSTLIHVCFVFLSHLPALAIRAGLYP